MILKKKGGLGSYAYDMHTLQCTCMPLVYGLDVAGLALVFVNAIVITVCYTWIFVFAHRNKHSSHTPNNNKSIQLAKTLFIAFSFYCVCW